MNCHAAPVVAGEGEQLVKGLPAAVVTGEGEQLAKGLPDAVVAGVGEELADGAASDGGWQFAAALPVAEQFVNDPTGLDQAGVGPPPASPPRTPSDLEGVGSSKKREVTVRVALNREKDSIR
jgi:hypothetical protein